MNVRTRFSIFCGAVARWVGALARCNNQTESLRAQRYGSNTAPKHAYGDELRRSKLEKPKVSLRKLGQYVRWLNSMRVWPKEVQVSSLHSDLCNGLLLCRLMKKLVPFELKGKEMVPSEYKGLNLRPLSQKPAIANLEQALGVIWRSGKVNNTRVPAAIDLYKGKADKISMLIQEVFEVYVMRDLRTPSSMRTMMRWYDDILAQYDRALPSECLVSPNSGLWEQFRTGVLLFLVVLHFSGQKIPIGYGSVGVGVGVDARDSMQGPLIADSARIYANPIDQDQYLHNTQQVFALLRASGVELLWTPADWVTFPDEDFVVLQLSHIFAHFKGRPCALTDNADGVSRATFDLIVDELRFKDCIGASPAPPPPPPPPDSSNAQPTAPTSAESKSKAAADASNASSKAGDSARSGANAGEGPAPEWNTSTVSDSVHRQERRRGSIAVLTESERTLRSLASPTAGQGSANLGSSSPRSPRSPQRTRAAFAGNLEQLEQHHHHQLEKQQSKEAALEARFSALALQASVLPEAAYDAQLKDLEAQKQQLRAEQASAVRVTAMSSCVKRPAARAREVG